MKSIIVTYCVLGVMAKRAEDHLQFATITMTPLTDRKIAELKTFIFECRAFQRDLLARLNGNL